MTENYNIWLIIGVMAAGSFGLRFVFLGWIGNRTLPDWVLRHLRYTAVAILPALVTPLVLWPAATGGTPEPARMSAAVVTILVGVWTRHVLWSILAGGVTLYLGLWLFG